MRTLSFILGLLVLAACVALPLTSLDIRMPFSAHMIRHTALLLLAAPLLAMSIPPAHFLQNTLGVLSAMTARVPAAAWLCGVLAMWIWHVPDWYNVVAGNGSAILSCAPPGIANTSSAHFAAALEPSRIPGTRLIPLLHELSLLVGGFLFCWPIVTPYREFRLPALHAVLYLASACVCCSLLGLLITFAPAGTYKNITMSDQQTGGMIMWIPCCFVYLSASMFLLIRWFSVREAAAPVSI